MRRIAPSSDPVWNERARSLLTFLQKHRNWEELAGWARRMRISQAELRNTIAHANRLIRHEDGKWWAVLPVPRDE